ncbi:MAG: hypothetical protein IT355_00250 [Gemmatimonadaceae bacterium]|nr:hypothetical protein [Gemmatimonadaceae bacterium]
MRATPTGAHGTAHEQVVACNEALVTHNLLLLAMLEQQHSTLDALQAFVVSVAHALDTARVSGAPDPRRAASRAHLATLTGRQREVLAFVIAGHPSKRIAAVLGISQRTVENHRASIMLRTGAASVPALAQLALLGGFDAAEVLAHLAVAQPAGPALALLRT